MTEETALQAPAASQSIDCNTALSRAALRLAVLGIPLWIAVSMMLGPLGVLFFVGVFALAITAWVNRLTITPERIMMPAWHFESIPTKSLRKIAIEHGPDSASYLVLHWLSDETEERQIKRISTKRLRGEKSVQLVGLFDRYCPQAEFDEQSREFLLGTKSKDDRANAASIELPYRPDDKLRNLTKLIISYEKYFWRVYLGTILIPAVLTLIIVPLYSATAWASPLWLGLRCTAVVVLFVVFGLPIIAVSAGAQGYLGLMEQPIFFGIVLAIVAFIAYHGIRCAFQPNKLQLDASGLSLKMVVFEKTIYKKFFPWTCFDRVTLNKPNRTSVPEQWEIQLTGARCRPIKLKLRAIEGTQDRARLLKAIERWTPTLTRDPELIEALTPPQKQSYTELWLQSLTSPPKRERLKPLSAGIMIKSGQFTILRQIGTGGQAVAYLASTATGDSTVVVKEFVLPVYVDKAARRNSVEKFEDDARMLQNLDHPQVVGLLDYFIEDHRAYLILEHITGRSLRKIVDEQGPMGNEQALSLAKQMCTILEYLHSLEPPLVHRDFAPDNLILNDDGILKLIDFNVAHQRQSHTVATVVGKHAYLPPEQFRGKPVPQSDIYAMGATIHFLLTGEDPEPVSESHPILQNSIVASELDEIVATCTRLDLKTRYQEARTVASDLAKVSYNEAPQAKEHHFKVPQGITMANSTPGQNDNEPGT